MLENSSMYRCTWTILYTSFLVLQKGSNIFGTGISYQWLIFKNEFIETKLTTLLTFLEISNSLADSIFILYDHHHLLPDYLPHPQTIQFFSLT